MKKYIFGFICIPLLIATTTLNTPQKAPDSDGSPMYKLMEITYLWELLKQDYEPIRERDETWLYEGFRSKYAMTKKYASLKMVEKAFSVPVFIRGPHDGEMDFNSTTSFGYYNTDFITELHASIETALKNPIYKAVIKKVYEKDLKNMALIYHDTYRYIYSDRAKDMEALKAKYLALISTPYSTIDGSMMEDFRDFDIRDFEVVDSADAREKKKRWNDYDAITAPAFWLRRSIDGTYQQLFELLDMVITEMEKK